MKRLREFEDSSDPLMRRAAELVRGTEPVAPSELRVRWARRRLNSAAHSRRLGVLRPAAAFIVVFGVAATAGAAWGTGRYFVDEYFGEHETSIAEPALQESVGRVSRQSSKALSRSSLVPPATETEATYPPLEEEALAPDVRSKGLEATGNGSMSERSTARSSSPPLPGGPDPLVAAESSSVEASPSGTGNASDAALVLRGLRALRQDGDPDEAARLLDEYRARLPEGALAEEALALSIEAALARGDANAVQLAETYLSRYPKGRFRDAARRAKAKAGAED